MTDIYITSYSAICNCGENIKEIYENITTGKNIFIKKDESVIKNKTLLLGRVETALPAISDFDYNTRTNRLVLFCLEQIKSKVIDLIKCYGNDKIGVVIGTTNTGVDEYEDSGNLKYLEISNPAEFLHNYLGLNSFFCGVSTACTSGAKAFSTAENLLNSGVCDAVIVGGVDSIANVPVFGFDSLEVESDSLSLPFSKNRKGMNIGEGAALFVLEKKTNNIANCIKLSAIGETSDAFHPATPDPTGEQAINAIKIALSKANLSPDDIGYINLHGTGTVANDLMEATAVSRVFGDKVSCSSTKPFTGHCLGAAASVEAAICLYILENSPVKLPANINDGQKDENLPELNFVSINDGLEEVSACISNSFGFGGTNSVIIFSKEKTYV